MKDKFLIADDLIVRSLVKKLPYQQRKAIFLRFWKNCSLAEISISLGVTPRKASKILRRGSLKIKFGCLGHPIFSGPTKNSFGKIFGGNYSW